MKKDLKVAFFLIVVLVGLAFVIGCIYMIMNYLIVGIIVAVFVSIIALLGFGYVVYALLNKINAHSHEIATRKLELHRSMNEDQLRLEREQARWEREQAREDARMREEAEIERRKLELEEKRIQLEAYKAQAVQVRGNDALIIRDYNGLGTRIAREPHIKAGQVIDTELVSEADVSRMIDSPCVKVHALDLLQDGELDGDNLVLGADQDGNLIKKTWRQLLSILILGLMGGGKTNTTVWLLYQLVLKTYRIALIDRHAKSDESTYARLHEFSQAFDTPVGDSPQAAMRVAKHVRKVFESRRDHGIQIDYKLIWCIEEFSALMRTLKDNESDWQEVAVFVAALVEDLGYEGRKYGIHVIAVGQATNASRSGGTEIRDLFHTRIVHGMRARQAQNLGMTEQKSDIQKLEVGQTIIDVEGREEPFFCQVPEVTEEFKMAVLARLKPRKTQSKLVLKETFAPSATWVLNTEPVQANTNRTPTLHQVPSTPAPVAPKLSETAQRVLDLRILGIGKVNTILEVWGVKKGSNAAYKKASDEYTQIIEMLEEFGYLKTQQ